MDKVELRRAAIARRDAIDLDVRAAKSAVICARLVELLDRLDAATPHTVAAYAAMGSEVDPAAFAAAAAKRGWRVAYPCILSATDAAACDQRMCMRAVAGAVEGYGGGCYDRYLPMLSPACQIIGIAFDEQRVDHVPTDAHDLPLPHIISA